MVQQRDFSEHTAQIIDDEICSLVKSIQEEVSKLLKEHHLQLEALAKCLLEKETLGPMRFRQSLIQKRIS